MAVILDTMKMVNDLVKAGVPDPQARAHVEIVVKGVFAVMATNDDLERLEERLKAHMEAGIADVKVSVSDSNWVQTGIILAIMSVLLTAGLLLVRFI